MTRPALRPPAQLTKTVLRSRLAAPLAVASLLASAAPAAHAASIWTPVASGTTDTITSIDHRASVTVIGTSGGKILRLTGSPLASTPVASFPGSSIIDVALNPSGSRAIAVLSGGRVASSADAGITWGAPVQLTTYRPDLNTCLFPSASSLTPLTEEATSVSWGSDYWANVTDDLKGSIEATGDGGSTWAEVGRNSTGTCNHDAVIKQVVAQSMSSAYVVDDLNNIGTTTDGFTTINGRGYFVGETTFAVDSAHSQQLIGGHLTYSGDGGNSFRSVPTVPADQTISPTHDTSYVGDTAIWVGDNGDIFTSPDGAAAYRQPADGADASANWHAVSQASASDAMVGGAGGALEITSSASSVPPIVTLAPQQPIPTPISVPAVIATPQQTPSIQGITPGGKSTATIPGASITLQGPTTCVKSGAAFTTTMSMRRITIKNNRIVKLTRVDFYVDGKRVKSDKVAPFKQTLKVPAAKAGTLHTVKAVGYIKVTKGKAPKKTATVTFASCA